MKKLLCTIWMFPALLLGQTPSQDQNYVKTITYKIATSTPVTTPPPATATVSVTYFDGLGRPVQNVVNQQSNIGTDIVTPIRYDGFGRQPREYLPYPTTSGSLLMRPDASVDAGLAAYAPYSGQSPYSEKLFENSPLNRVLKQGAPGNDWALGANHEIRMEYKTNIANEVKMFSATATYDSPELFTIALTQAGTTPYATGQLYKTITKNENWTSASGTNNTIEEFTDKQGRIVLKRTYGLSYTTPTTESVVTHDTYYVYDQFGNLTYVIPPKVTIGSVLSELDGLCYQYKYDSRNRLVEKKLPGKQWEFIVYDVLDRVIAMGPALSPFSNSSTNGWLFTKYDQFNRPVITGWTTETLTSAGRKSLQAARTAQITNLSEVKTTTTADVTISGVTFRYPNVTWPTVTTATVLSVNYYDNYSFPNAPTVPVSVMIDASQPVFYNNTTKPLGLATGSYVRVPELTTTTPVRGETSYILYDKKARPVRSRTINYLGGFTQTDSRLDDFSGKTLKVETTHKLLSASTLLTTTETFTYTDQDRLLTHMHKLNSGTAQLLARNEYDHLGQLIAKRVGGDITGSTCWQKMDYTYNIRGWLTGINDIAQTATPPASILPGSDPYDLFMFKVNYNTVENRAGYYTGKALYNGNISETHWRTNNDNLKRQYGYFYDGLNRLQSAIYMKGAATAGVSHMYDESMGYDKNGNIMDLQRNGDYDDIPGTLTLEIDDLVYTYGDTANPNRLTKVVDSSGDTSGFSDGINDIDYTYDLYGNMVRDLNKGINAISYNHLNLPQKITFAGANNTIEYLYNSLGVKVYKKVTTNGIAKVTQYMDGFQYEDNVLTLFPTAEGYVDCVSPALNYIFQYKDHLGNNRVNFGLNTAGKVVILEENNYYPFGLNHKNYNVSKAQWTASGGNIDIDACIDCKYKYKYNGQEWQDELGLNTTSMDFRIYDNSIGRFTSIDILAELAEQLDKSPYSFAWNNPIFYNDPLGLCPECPNGAKNGDIYNSQGGATYIFQDGHWNRQGGTLDEVVIKPAPSPSSNNADNALVGPGLSPIIAPKPISQPNPSPNPTGLSKLGAVVLWALLYSPDTSPYSPANQDETLNPNNVKKQDDQARLRVQLQKGKSNLASMPAFNTIETGVTTLQADVALVATRELARVQYKNLIKSPQAQLAFAKMAKKIQSVAPNGIIAGTRTTLQETFIYNNETYRIDVESLRGHNLRQ